MEKRDNYAIRAMEAKKRFLTFDQKELIQRWGLEHDEDFLYMDFVQEAYKINRKDGDIIRCMDGKQAGFNQVLSIFDLLCHSDKAPVARPFFAPVNSLEGVPRTASVGTSAFHNKYADIVDRNQAAFRKSCERMKGKAVPVGDIGYQFEVFGGIKVQLKFYESDDEFPASLTIFWTCNTLEFIYYETTFYIAGYLLDRIVENMIA